LSICYEDTNKKKFSGDYSSPQKPTHYITLIHRVEKNYTHVIQNEPIKEDPQATKTISDASIIFHKNYLKMFFQVPRNIYGYTVKYIFILLAVKFYHLSTYNTLYLQQLYS